MSDLNDLVPAVAKSLDELATSISERHKNVLVAGVNDHCLRLSVNHDQGYDWHHHPDSDELFIVLEGELSIELRDRSLVVLRPHDTLTVPKGVVHRTFGRGRAVNLCVENANAKTVFVTPDEKPEGGSRRAGKSLLAVAYPKLSSRDVDWVQEVRKQHDELSYRAIAPHITLFFPCADFSPEVLITAVRDGVSGFAAIPFTLSSALLMPPANGGDYSYVFLVPDQGFADILRLHDAIYGGVLAPAQRLDIPFIPHLTVANSIDLKGCKRLTDKLNQEIRPIEGTVDSIAVVEEDGGGIRLLEMIPLGERD